MKSNREIKKSINKALSIGRGRLIFISLGTILLGGINLFFFLLTQLNLLLVSSGMHSGAWGEGTQGVKRVYLVLAVHLVVSMLLGGSVELGYDRILFLRIHEEPIPKKTLFYYIPVWTNAMMLRLLMSVKVILWTFVLIIPGIMAILNYSLAPYIMALYPKISPPEAIRISSHLMRGYKKQLVLLILSFLDEIIISILALGLPLVYVIPRMKMSVAIFCRERIALHDEEVYKLQGGSEENQI